MNITKAEIEQYLRDVFTAVNAGRYQIAQRDKNEELYREYVFTEEDAKKVILSLTVYDFSEAVPNEHPDYPEEALYIFGKDVMLLSRYGETEETVSLYIKFNKLTNQYVFIISLHKQEYPLSYKFR